MNLVKCAWRGCTVTEDLSLTKNEKGSNNLELDHVVSKRFFPAEYKKGKKYDLINIGGEILSNRRYLCKEHHLRKDNIIISYIWNQLSLEQQNVLRKKAYNHITQKYYGEKTEEKKEVEVVY